MSSLRNAFVLPSIFYVINVWSFSRNTDNYGERERERERERQRERERERAGCSLTPELLSKNVEWLVLCELGQLAPFSPGPSFFSFCHVQIARLHLIISFVKSYRMGLFFCCCCFLSSSSASSDLFCVFFCALSFSSFHGDAINRVVFKDIPYAMQLGI